MLLCRPAANAQQDLAPSVYPEFRVDGIVARGNAVLGGAGVVFPLGIYARLSVDGSAGAAWRDGKAATVGRVDGIVRFLLDPFRETKAALSIGGGLSVPVERAGSRWPYLVVVADVEGRGNRAFTPALQVGLGGGARIGVVIRRSPIRWR